MSGVKTEARLNFWVVWIRLPCYVFCTFILFVVCWAINSMAQNSLPTQHKSETSAPHNVRYHTSFCSKAQIHDPPDRNPWPALPSQKLPCPASFAPPPPEPPGDALQLPLHPVPAATAAPTGRVHSPAPLSHSVPDESHPSPSPAVQGLPPTPEPGS